MSRARANEGSPGASAPGGARGGGAASGSFGHITRPPEFPPGPSHVPSMIRAVAEPTTSTTRDEGLYLLLLRDAADAVAGTTTLEEALGTTVDLVAERLGFDVCSIYLTDEKGDLVLTA